VRYTDLEDENTFPNIQEYPRTDSLFVGCNGSDTDLEEDDTEGGGQGGGPRRGRSAKATFPQSPSYK